MWNDWNREEITIYPASLVSESKAEIIYKVEVAHSKWHHGELTKELGYCIVNVYPTLGDLRVVCWPVGHIPYKEKEKIRALIKSHMIIYQPNKPVVIDHSMNDED